MERQFKTERAVQQQELIRGALMELMEDGTYEKITVCDICRRARIPRRTFYYYFDGKEEVLSSLVRQILLECNLETMFTADIDRETVERGFARFFRYWGERRSRELAALMRNDLGQKLVNASLQWVEEESQWEDSQSVSTLMGITCVFYTLFYWQEHGCSMSPETVASYVTDILTNPIYRVK